MRKSPKERMFEKLNEGLGERVKWARLEVFVIGYVLTFWFGEKLVIFKLKWSKKKLSKIQKIAFFKIKLQISFKKNWNNFFAKKCEKVLKKPEIGQNLVGTMQTLVFRVGGIINLVGTMSEIEQILSELCKPLFFDFNLVGTMQTLVFRL